MIHALRFVAVGREYLTLSTWVKFSADDILKYFSYISQKTGFDISSNLSPMETSCMKCQILFSWKSKKHITNLSSDDQMPHFVASDLGLHCLVRIACPNTLGKYSV